MKLMKGKTTILFYLNKSKQKKDGSCPIMVRITNNGREQFTTPFVCKIDLWDNMAQKVIGRNDEAKTINAKLDSIKRSLEDKESEIEDKGDIPTAAEIKRLYLNLNQSLTSLLRLFDELVRTKEKLYKGKRLSYTTFSRYAKTRVRISEFLKKEYHVEDIDIKQVNVSFIERFESYLFADCHLHVNTAAKLIKFLKKVITDAFESGLIKHNCFRSIKIKTVKTKRGFLTAEELQKIIQKEMPTNHLKRVKDMFLFSCFTGMSFIDICNLTFEDVRTIDNEKWIIKERKKTGVESMIKLLDIPMMLIDKYTDSNRKSIFPVISNQKMNQYLKKIAEICNIDKRVTFHLARHTFATTVALDNGVPLESVQHILGHSDITTTQVYAQMTIRRLNNDMTDLQSKLPFKKIG